MDLEQAMEKILKLTDEKKALEDQVKSYEIKSEEYEGKLTANASEISRLKELNMKYFNRLTQEVEEVDKQNHTDEAGKHEADEIQLPTLDEWLNEW